MTLSQIGAILQAVILFISALLAGNPTPVQKQAAIIKATEVLSVAQNYLNSSSSTVNTNQPNPCHTDTTYGRIDCSTPQVVQEPIVYLEGEIDYADGRILKLKGANRDSGLKRLGLVGENIPDTNPYRIKGFYPKLSISAGDKLKIVVHKNPNSRANTICAQDSFEIPKTAIENLSYNIANGYGNYYEIGFNVNCSSDTGRTTGWDQYRLIDREWDAITIDLVK